MATGRVCVVNCLLAVLGVTAMLVHHGEERSLAATLTGAYFFAQAILARRDMLKGHG